MRQLRQFLVWCFFLLLPLAVTAAPGEQGALKVVVLEDAPPMAYRDAGGQLTGFSVAVMQALCAEMNARCEFDTRQFEYLLDDLASGHFDVAAVGLLNTPERRQKVLFTRPVYRSQTLFFAKPGVTPGQPEVRVSTFKGSAQEGYIRQQGWKSVGAQTAEDMVEQLVAGVAHACVVPLMSSLSLRKSRAFLQLGLVPVILQTPEFDNAASFAITPQRADLKPALDKALDRIKVNGVYDRINSKFLPFRVD